MAQELTEDVVRKEFLEAVATSDLNPTNLYQINKVLSGRLGRDLEPWKPVIKKVAVEYTSEFIKGQQAVELNETTFASIRDSFWEKKFSDVTVQVQSHC